MTQSLAQLCQALEQKVKQQWKPEQLANWMCEEYANTRIEFAESFDEDGDMLIAQCYVDSFSEEKSLYWTLVRQVIIYDPDKPDEQSDIYQLELRLQYPCTEDNQHFSEDSDWYEEPSQLEAFRKYLLNSTATQWCFSHPPKVTEVNLNRM
ncbi:hypothetical protein [Pleionea sp. CnH1-48]|uniref:hypothetical protein n=1 Tax=Pleionea sp. CnH1-48 TaxID=2954494 RepID=UPI00209803A0|nr:hypothetical protein [Pleionea sp. CnH1-48]MCO7224221.1 hypothetical protein [Pleionea sp. CnH1-48]